MKAVASIVYGDVPGFPAGSAVDHIEVSVTPAGGSAVSQAVPPGATSATFDNLDAGDYTGSAFGVDAGGNTLGTPVIFSFTLTTGPATITLSLPSSVSAVQG